MTTIQKLTNAMNRADLSGFEQTFALLLYEVHGFDHAQRYVNQKDLDRRLEVTK